MTITFDAARFLRRAICRWKGHNVKNSFMALSHFCQNRAKVPFLCAEIHIMYGNIFFFLKFFLFLKKIESRHIKNLLLADLRSSERRSPRRYARRKAHL